jgi:hypothetical protein
MRRRYATWLSLQVPQTGHATKLWHRRDNPHTFAGAYSPWLITVPLQSDRDALFHVSVHLWQPRNSIVGQWSWETTAYSHVSSMRVTNSGCFARFEGLKESWRCDNSATFFCLNGGAVTSHRGGLVALLWLLAHCAVPPCCCLTSYRNPQATCSNDKEIGVRFQGSGKRYCISLLHTVQFGSGRGATNIFYLIKSCRHHLSSSQCWYLIAGR